MLPDPLDLLEFQVFQVSRARQDPVDLLVQLVQRVRVGRPDPLVRLVSKDNLDP